ncbi:serine/threonine-protein phosphatase, partial [Micromonospora aurantiaca]|nr:serine/threonine-protein phosphatase [Micromonospora aurantiaca]
MQLLPPRVRAVLRRIPLLVALYRLARQGKLTRERNVFAVLAVLAIAIGFASTSDSRGLAPSGALVLIVLGGGLLLKVRSLLALLGVVVAMAAYNAWKDVAAIGPGMIATLTITAVLALTLARTRQQLGVQGLRGDSMLLELRDRLRR